MDSQSNQSVYFSFRTNNSLADALSDINPGDKYTVKVELMCLSKDDAGISSDVVPGTIVPDGFELEDNPSGGEVQKTPAPEPPGSLAQTPIQVLSILRKKGKNNQ